MTFWVGTGWKMNKTLEEGLRYAAALRSGLEGLDDRIQPFVLPPYTALREVARALDGNRVHVGAQNMHWAESGAWTGEISPTTVSDCGATLVELGHSERRAYFNETNQTVGLKVEAAVRHGLIPLICVGETLEERESGSAEAVLVEQVSGSLERLGDAQLDATILFAYEPVWAIGEHGVPAAPEYANQQHGIIAEAAGRELAGPPPVLYGGSVNAENAASLFSQNQIDGLFIGRAAWSEDGFIGLLQGAAAVLANSTARSGHRPTEKGRS